MQTTIDDAIAAEVRAEVARQGLSRNEIAGRAGVNVRTWSRYFGPNRERDIPLAVLAVVCGELGVSLVDIIGRAEAMAPAPDPLLGMLSKRQRAEVDKARRRHGVVRSDDSADDR